MTQIILKTGILNISLNETLNQLVGFGSRENKKRGFLFVSKVLGKHIPVKPSKMINTYKQMASLIPKTNNPTLFIGFAETATALGHGVFEAANFPNSFYIHSTRYHTSKKILFSFTEDHCHAPNHILYMPTDKKLKNMLKDIKQIILIDDEVSTGNTANNLINELKKTFPQVEKYSLLTILNWTTKNYDNFEYLSLYKDTFSFKPKKYDIDTNIISQTIKPKDLTDIIPYNFGRYGVKKLNIDLQNYVDIKKLKNKKVLVLGTSEFMYVPFLLAKYLEDNEIECYFQATTRSPVNIDGSITSKISFKDNYFEEIDNFLYNVIDKEYDKIFLCYETVKLPKNFNLKNILEEKFDVEEIFIKG